MNVKRNKFIDDEALVSDADVSNSNSVDRSEGGVNIENFINDQSEEENEEENFRHHLQLSIHDEETNENHTRL